MRTPFWGRCSKQGITNLIRCQTKRSKDWTSLPTSRILALVLSLLACQAQAQYTITDLGVLPGGISTVASAINNRGQVTGGSVLSVSTTHAFLYSNGQMRDIGTLGGDFSDGASINDHGQIAGTSTTIPNVGQFDIRGFLYTAGSFQNLGVLDGGPDSEGTAVNDNGVVAGNAYLPSPSPVEAFIYIGGQIQNLLVGGGSSATGINDQNEVVGFSDNLVGPIGFLWKNSKTLQLPSLGSGNSVAKAINKAGHIVGSSTFASSNVSHAVLYVDGQINALDTSTAYSVASAINDKDQVVGYFEKAVDFQAGNGMDYACLFRSGRIVDLNSFIPKKSGWILTGATGINDVGQIVGNGKHNGLTRAFLMRPNR